LRGQVKTLGYPQGLHTSCGPDSLEEVEIEKSKGRKDKMIEQGPVSGASEVPNREGQAFRPCSWTPNWRL